MDSSTQKWLQVFATESHLHRYVQAQLSPFLSDGIDDMLVARVAAVLGWAAEASGSLLRAVKRSPRTRLQRRAAAKCLLEALVQEVAIGTGDEHGLGLYVGALRFFENCGAAVSEVELPTDQMSPAPLSPVFASFLGPLCTPEIVSRFSADACELIYSVAYTFDMMENSPDTVVLRRFPSYLARVLAAQLRLLGAAFAVYWAINEPLPIR